MPVTGKNYRNTYAEADRDLDGGLYRFISENRERGASLNQMSRLLLEKGIDVAPQTISLWYSVLFPREAA